MNLFPLKAVANLCRNTHTPTSVLNTNIFNVCFIEGVKHRGVVCCACKQSPVVGMYWKCLDCKVTSVHMCTSCYMSDEHDQAHAFLRFDGSSENG